MSDPAPSNPPADPPKPVPAGDNKDETATAILRQKKCE